MKGTGLGVGSEQNSCITEGSQRGIFDVLGMGRSNEHHPKLERDPARDAALAHQTKVALPLVGIAEDATIKTLIQRCRGLVVNIVQARMETHRVQNLFTCCDSHVERTTRAFWKRNIPCQKGVQQRNSPRLACGGFEVWYHHILRRSFGLGIKGALRALQPARSVRKVVPRQISRGASGTTAAIQPSSALCKSPFSRGVSHMLVAFLARPSRLGPRPILTCLGNKRGNL
mmetsp:Transcript_80781/g.168528  ORF Transcript_80781/g.168528 Transcript_80781/m.168528 type:complete len:229 (-) Transcript_80781:1606-2292(-)